MSEICASVSFTSVSTIVAFLAVPRTSPGDSSLISVARCSPSSL